MQYSSPELEASNRAYVQLAATGQYVEFPWTGLSIVTFLNVRASIPDAPSGGGLTATLDLFVNGEFRQALNLNSKQTWGYEGPGDNHYSDPSQNPADGHPRIFFDDTHAFISGAPVTAGQTIRLQKSAANTASFYYIDVVDFEAPPPPLNQRSAQSLSIATYGAIASDPNIDNSAAIQRCVDDAKRQGKSVWIPVGTFYVKTLGGISAESVTIEGAGMWYSTIYRNVPLPNGTPLGAIFNLKSCTVRHFALDSNAVGRHSEDGAGGAMDTTGNNWLADGIWTQHTLSGFWASGTGGTVQNCRLTSIWADGINLNNVALDGTVGNSLVARNNFVRGTGDDAIAINCVDHNGDTHYTPMSNIKILNNTSKASWGGKGVAIYGGSGHIVMNNYISDTARYIGLGVGKFGVNGCNLTSATVKGNVIERSGGNGYLQRQAALHIGNGGDGQNVGTVANARVSDNTINDALFYGVSFSTSFNTMLVSNTINSPGLDGIVIGPGGPGSAFDASSGSAIIRDNTVTGLAPGRSPLVQLSNTFLATVSGNHW